MPATRYAHPMRLILIRHGKAENRDPKNKTDDALRALTPDGKKKMRVAAKGLHRLYPHIDLLATSPLVRTVQTAEIIFAAYGDKPQFLELNFLSGDGQPPKELVDWIKDKDLDAATVALVGHGPILSEWAGFFVTGKLKEIVTMKKGAVCVIDFPKGLAAGKGIISGVLQSSDLRRVS